MKVHGKLALVTGGTSGIGLHIAKALAEAGADVVVTGRNPERTKAAAEAHPRIDGVVCDVTNDAAIQALLEAMDARGGLSLLVNNAGVMDFFDVREGHPIARQAEEIDIDVMGPVRMVHHFLPGMLTRGGAIVNVSSGLAYIPFAPAPVYSGAKAFVHAWTRSLRRQLRGSSVHIVELLPPVVDTPLAKGLDPSFKRMPPEKLARDFLRGLERDKDEITPGQSGLLKWISRLAPGFGFWLLNRKTASDA